MNLGRSSDSKAKKGSVEKARSASAMLSKQVSPTPSQAASSGTQRSTRLKRRPRRPGSWRTISACRPVQCAKNSSRERPALRRMKLTRLIMIAPPSISARPLKELQRDAVVYPEIGAARADIGAAVDIDRAVRIDGPCAASDRMPPRQSGVLDRKAKVNVARVRRRIGIRALSGRLIVEQFKDDAARQIHEGGLDRDAGNSDNGPEIGPIENCAPARRDAQEGLPESQRLVEVGDAHADMMNGGGGCDRTRHASCDHNLSPKRVRQILKSLSALRENIAVCSSLVKPEMIAA